MRIDVFHGDTTMNSDTPAYPIWSAQMEFDCLPEMQTIFVIASSKHFGVLVPLKNLPEVSDIQEEDNPHACLFDDVVDEFEVLVENYLNEAKEHDFPLSLPEHEDGDKEFFGEFVELSGDIPVFKDGASDIEYLDMDGRYLFIAIEGATLDEFIGENNNSSVGHILH